MPTQELFMKVSEALHSRRSIRAFTDRAVDEALLREILTTAGRAPSGGNLQPWKISALSGQPLAQLKTAMSERLKTKPMPDKIEYPIYPDPLPALHKQARNDLSEAMYAAVGIARENKVGRMQFITGNFQCWGAPVVLFCYINRHFGSAQWSDLGMYLQSVMLLLREHGLDSCPQEAWSMYHGTVRAYTNMPDEQLLFCGLSIGYADTEAPVNQFRNDRFALDQFAEFHGF
jgi:nitroreductase